MLSLQDLLYKSHCFVVKTNKQPNALPVPGLDCYILYLPSYQGAASPSLNLEELEMAQQVAGS